LTENGVLRIVGHSRYPNSPDNPAAVADLMVGLYSLPGHVFWPDDVSLHDTQIVDQTQLKNSGQLTDTYLLALAFTHGGQLATFDARLVTTAVRNGATWLCVLK
jgi:predicted nucleic acid-binding protein